MKVKCIKLLNIWKISRMEKWANLFSKRLINYWGINTKMTISKTTNKRKNDTKRVLE